MTTRSAFIQLMPLAAFALFDTQTAMAVEVDPKEPQASALGYVGDVTKADKAKFSKYATGPMCTTCQLFQGKGADAAGSCPWFPGKTRAARGWCSAYTKKA